MNNRWMLILSGLIILGINIKISLLSHSFIFGVGHADRPIIEFLGYMLLAFLVYWLVLEQLWRNKPGRKGERFNLAWILIIGILVRFVYFPSQFIQETDPYRYVWDGQMSVSQHNPYSYSPQDAFERGILSLDPTRQEAVQTINERINHPDVKTIYPPGAQFLFALSQKISPWSFGGWRGMVAIAEILILILMVLILKRLKLSLGWVALYAWSPLIIKEFTNSLHLDVFAVLFICLMIYALLKKHHRLALLSLAIATSIKWFAVIFLPFLLIMFRQNFLRSLIPTVMFSGLIAASYLPFSNAKFGTLFEGLLKFSAEWKVNDGLFTIITSVIHKLPLPFDTNIVSRIAVVLIFGLILLLSCRWLMRRRTISRFLRVSLISLSALFFLLPTGNPWYFTWVFPFLIIFPSRALVAFSALVFLYYLDFYFMYQNQRDMFTWVRLLEYGLFFTILGLELCFRHRRLRGKNKFSQILLDRTGQGNPTVAIIIPVYNESKVIEDSLKHFISLGANEVIIVDGKSADGTYDRIKEKFPEVMCYQTAFPERSLQMNLGAFESKSDVFIFAHIDMNFPLNAIEMVREKIQNGFIGGGFKKAYNSSTWLLRLYIYLLNQVYLARMHCLVGTNAMFVTREIFERMNGFSEVALLEDMIFSECLNKQGRIAIIDQPVIVSSRKYFKNGVIKQILRNIRIVLGYKFLHESPVKLREIYQG
ncbi:MAG: glycosyltransferase [Candidatus Omnitrophica bacterium]|nr:glycosyltransferase [Candidatus Omnitrophota bacterium]